MKLKAIEGLFQREAVTSRLLKSSEVLGLEYSSAPSEERIQLDIRYMKEPGSALRNKHKALLKGVAVSAKEELGAEMSSTETVVDESARFHALGGWLGPGVPIKSVSPNPLLFGQVTAFARRQDGAQVGLLTCDHVYEAIAGRASVLMGHHLPATERAIGTTWQEAGPIVRADGDWAVLVAPNGGEGVAEPDWLREDHPLRGAGVAPMPEEEHEVVIIGDNNPVGVVEEIGRDERVRFTTGQRERILSGQRLMTLKDGHGSLGLGNSGAPLVVAGGDGRVVGLLCAGRLDRTQYLVCPIERVTSGLVGSGWELF